ncbi:MAG: bifunctional sulfate adenylyltransferase/adenylylsulfate kinase [Armatimonadota bacterium]|jgi:sulfate adenylyltransferase
MTNLIDVSDVASPCPNIPYGGALVNLIVDGDRARELEDNSRAWPTWTLTNRQICDLELLMTGAFSPLRGFMGPEDYQAVCAEMRLADGTVWPMPITLDIDGATASSVGSGDRLVLRDLEGMVVAVMQVQELWRPDRAEEARLVFGTDDRSHPGVAPLFEDAAEYCVSGPIEAVNQLLHYDFTELRMTPAEVRAQVADAGWRRLVGFQTRNPMHRAHYHITRHAMEEAQAALLLHPAVGKTLPGDIDHFTRVRCYMKILDRYPPGHAMLSLLPLAMRMAGPREALWHAILRRNYGCTHFIVGRDHAGACSPVTGEPYYHPAAAQELVGEYQDEIGIELVEFENMVYVETSDEFIPENRLTPAHGSTRSLSGSALRESLETGGPIPEWYSFPEVVEELRRRHPPRHERGLVIFVVGLPCSGKSTVAKMLTQRLLETSRRAVTLLDGDVVRKHLSTGLGFSKEDRDANVQRIGYVASEISRHGGIAICAQIAPYADARERVRELCPPDVGFTLVYVATPIEVCERRDHKGLYSRARSGELRNFTGISDPFEVPEDPEVVVDPAVMSRTECVESVLRYLVDAGYVVSEEGVR